MKQKQKTKQAGTYQYGRPEILEHDKEAKFVSGPVTATVWHNKAKVAGEVITFRNINLSRAITFPDGRQIDQYEFLNNDFTNLITVLNNAYSHMKRMRERDGDQNCD